MGSFVEINDTLEITTEQGFPADLLDRDRHVCKPITLSEVAGRVFEFRAKPSARIYQLDPVRVYLAHNIAGKWLFWGRVYIQSETISKRLQPDGSWKEGDWITSGTFRIVDLYDPAYQETFTRREAPSDRNFFLPGPQKAS